MNDNTTLGKLLKGRASRLLLLGLCLAFLTTPVPGPSTVHAATTFLFGSRASTVRVGEEIMVDLDMQAPQAVNAIEVWLSFPHKLVEVVRVEKEKSLASLWAQDPEIDNASGLLMFATGVPGAGFVGKGHLARVVLRARAPGVAVLAYTNHSQVSLDDGRGTADTVSLAKLSLAIVSPIPFGAPIGKQEPPIGTIAFLLLLLLFLVLCRFGVVSRITNILELYKYTRQSMNRALSIVLLVSLFLPAFVHANSASLTLNPKARAADVGDLIPVRLRLKMNGEAAVNALGAKLHFPPKLLTLVSVSKTESAISLWAEGPTIGPGELTFSGGTPQSITSDDAPVLTLNFRVRAAGTAVLALDNVHILLADGKGTDIAILSTPITLTLLTAPPRVVPRPSGAPKSATSTPQKMTVEENNLSSSTVYWQQKHDCATTLESSQATERFLLVLLGVTYFLLVPFLLWRGWVRRGGPANTRGRFKPKL